MDAVDQDFLSEGERAFLLALNRLGVRYLLVGMSAALLQGARGATEDVDIWFESTDDPRIVAGVEVKVLPLARTLHSKLTAARVKDEPGIHQIRLAISVLDDLKRK